MDVKEIKSARPVTPDDVKVLRRTVEDIIQAVGAGGDEAIAQYSRKFDGHDGPFRVTDEQIDAAKKELSTELIEGLDFAIQQVTAFAKAQRAQITEFEQEIAPGVYMGHRLIPPGLLCGVRAGGPLSVRHVRRHVAGPGSRGRRHTHRCGVVTRQGKTH